MKERGGSGKSPDQQFSSQNNNHLKEKGKALSGFPNSHSDGPNKPESQPLLNVWEILERRVRLKDHPRGEEFEQEAVEVLKLSDLKHTYGTVRDRNIFELYDKVRYTPGNEPGRGRYRRLSQEEFQQFRTEVEQMSDEELEKTLPPKSQQRLTLAHFTPYIPEDDDYDFDDD